MRYNGKSQQRSNLKSKKLALQALRMIKPPPQTSQLSDFFEDLLGKGITIRRKDLKFFEDDVSDFRVWVF
jgi:hypothetical protein